MKENAEDYTRIMAYAIRSLDIYEGENKSETQETEKQNEITTERNGKFILMVVKLESRKEKKITRKEKIRKNIKSKSMAIIKAIYC